MDVPPNDPRLAHIKRVDLTPWHPARWIALGYITLVAAMSAAGFWLSVVTPLKAPLIIKLMVVTGGLTQIFGLYSTFMWVWCHRGIRVDNFWQLVRGPEPEDGGERRLWHWGRRLYSSWVLVLVCMALLVIAGWVPACGCSPPDTSETAATSPRPTLSSPPYSPCMPMPRAFLEVLDSHSPRFNPCLLPRSCWLPS